MDLQLLGPLVVSDERGELAVGAQKERAVLSALALRVGRIVAIGELLDALWQDDPPATAVKTLQGYVSKIRRVVGREIVRTERPGYVLRVPPASVDVVRFDELVRLARSNAVDGEHAMAVENYGDALDLWRGPPLPDLAESEMGRIEIARLDALQQAVREEQIESRLAVGEHHLAIPDLEALAAEAPLRERTWALLMLALYRSGRQSDALRAYQVARQVLVNRIGVEPGNQLRDLEAAIIAHDPSLELGESRPPAADSTGRSQSGRARTGRSRVGTTTVSAPTGDTPERPRDVSWARSEFPFAGREGELGEIRDSWDRAVETGLRHAILIGGAPGIGKTRLVAEACAGIERAGGVILFGRCEEGLGAPYQPLVEALDSLVAMCTTDELTELLGPLGGELTRVLPGLSARLPSLAAPLNTEPDTERHRLFEAISEVIERLSVATPVLLVLDDLQWATKPTLLLLRHLVTASRPARLLVTATYRTTELSRTQPLTDALADLRREERVRRLGLEGLDEAATMALAERAADHTLDEGGQALVRRVHQESAGNPFFFWEMLLHLVETEMIIRRAGRWTYAEGAVHQPLPESIREVLARRLSGLPETTNALLRIAALLGSEFDYRMLATVASMDDDDVLDGLDLARRAGAVAESTGRYGQFSFSHDLIRRGLQEELSTTRRVRLHWEIAVALERFYGDEQETHLEELAHHYSEGALAGDESRVRQVCRTAGDAALRALAFEEAAAHYETALAFTPIGDGVDRYELLIDRGRALKRSGSQGHGDAMREAIAIARERDDAERFGRGVLELRPHAYLDIASAADQGIEALLREALDRLAGRHELEALRAQLASNLALTVTLSEPRDEGVRLSAGAVELARTGGDDRVLAEVLINHIWVITGPDTVDERLLLADEVTSLAEALDDPVIAIKAQNCHNLAVIELGRLDEGERAARAGVDRAEFLREPLLAWGFRVHLAAIASLKGTVAEVEQLADELLQLGNESGVDQSTVLQVYSRLLFAARYEQGRLEEFEAPLQGLVDAHPLVEWVVTLGVVYAECGRTDEALDVLRKVGGHRPRRDLTWMPMVMLTSQVVGELHDEVVASELYDEMLAFASRNSIDGAASSGPVALGLARCASALGRYGDAERHFAQAADLCEAWGAPMWAARTAFEHARMLRRQDSEGNQTRSNALLDSCTTTAARTGQTGLLQRADALLRA